MLERTLDFFDRTDFGRAPSMNVDQKSLREKRRVKILRFQIWYKFFAFNLVDVFTDFDEIFRKPHEID